ncbi:MAG TPA: hypothetical protein VLA33_05205 [Gemmatimonadota bacterium]|nr:hypothetical protein [Gemmatimonadota bacterium]
MVIWALVILVMLMIPLLAIVIDSDFGRAFARRISHDSQAGDEEMVARVERLEGEVRYLGETLEALREETTFVRSLLEDKSEPRSLPPGD